MKMTTRRTRSKVRPATKDGVPAWLNLRRLVDQDAVQKRLSKT
jgi:hypothetical protein